MHGAVRAQNLVHLAAPYLTFLADAWTQKCGSETEQGEVKDEHVTMKTHIIRSQYKVTIIPYLNMCLHWPF